MGSTATPMQPHHPLAPAPVNIRRKIFEFLVKHQDNQDQLPSQETIRELFGGCTDDVDLHLEQLAREGLLILDKEGGNGITLAPTYTPAPRIEVLGRVADHLAGAYGGSCHGSIALDLRGMGVPIERGMFAVQVLDNRMSDAGIEYGDIALLVHSTPMRGDIVAVEEGEVMVLRRYIVVAGIPHFLAENPTHPELRPGWDQKMQGVLWGWIRASPCARTDGENVERRSSKGTPVAPRQKLRGRAATVTSGPSHPVKHAGKSRASGLPKKSSSPATDQSEWPKPPSGVELNESTPPFLLTEDAVHYEPWGEPRSHA